MKVSPSVVSTLLDETRGRVIVSEPMTTTPELEMTVWPSGSVKVVAPPAPVGRVPVPVPPEGLVPVNDPVPPLPSGGILPGGNVPVPDGGLVPPEKNISEQIQKFLVVCEF